MTQCVISKIWSLKSTRARLGQIEFRFQKLLSCLDQPNKYINCNSWSIGIFNHNPALQQRLGHVSPRQSLLTNLAFLKDHIRKQNNSTWQKRPTRFSIFRTIQLWRDWNKWKYFREVLEAWITSSALIFSLP